MPWAGRCSLAGALAPGGRVGDDLGRDQVVQLAQEHLGRVHLLCAPSALMRCSCLTSECNLGRGNHACDQALQRQLERSYFSHAHVCKTPCTRRQLAYRYSSGSCHGDAWPAAAATPHCYQRLPMGGRRADLPVVAGLAQPRDVAENMSDSNVSMASMKSHCSSCARRAGGQSSARASQTGARVADYARVRFRRLAQLHPLSIAHGGGALQLSQGLRSQRSTLCVASMRRKKH